jgi:uncharacterized protein (TIGR03000 family)
MKGENAMKRATCLLAVAIAILVWSVPLAFARGGGHGGGGHGGGGHGGYAHSYGGGHGYGGYGRGYGGGGYYGRGYGYGGYGGYGYGGFWPGFGLGYGLGYGLGWGYPYNGYGYGYPAYDYGYTYPYDYSGGYYPGYPNYYGSAQPAVPATSVATAFPVRLDVMVPDPQAQVWINGQLTQASGTERVFVSSPIEQGYTYTYNMRAAWKQNGHQTTVDRNVQVTPGALIRVDFGQHLTGDSVSTD